MKGVSIAAIELNHDINSCPIRHQQRHNGLKFLRKVPTVSLCQINLTPRSTDASSLSLVKDGSPTWNTTPAAAAGPSLSSTTVWFGQWVLNIDVDTTRRTTLYRQHPVAYAPSDMHTRAWHTLDTTDLLQTTVCPQKTKLTSVLFNTVSSNHS